MLKTETKLYRFKSKVEDLDKNTKALFYNLDNIRNEKYQKEFNDWLNINPYFSEEKLKFITNRDRIETFNDNIISILKKYNLKIKNEKEFKNELASFIYNLS